MSTDYTEETEVQAEGVHKHVDPSDDQRQAHPTEDTEDPEVFDRSYVTKLRQEAAEYRTSLKDAQKRTEGLETALWQERVDRLGILADPADLPFDADALEDPEVMREQAEQLVAQKPHLRSTRITGTAWQDEQPQTEELFSLAGLMQSRA